MRQFNFSDQWKNIPKPSIPPLGLRKFVMDFTEKFYLQTLDGLALLQQFNGKVASVSLDCFVLDNTMEIEMQTEPTDIVLLYVLEGYGSCFYQASKKHVTLEPKRHYLLPTKAIDKITFSISAGRFLVFQVSLPIVRLDNLLPGLITGTDDDKNYTNNNQLGLQIAGITNKTVRNKIMEIIHSRANGTRLELLLKARALDLLYLYLESTRHPVLERQLTKRDRLNLEEIKSYISQNLDARLDNGSLAKIYGKSISVFRRDFTVHFAIPPHAFIKLTRLGHAMETIIKTDKPIGTIALEVGYSDISSFSRAFKQQFQHPSEWFRRNNNFL